MTMRKFIRVAAALALAACVSVPLRAQQTQPAIDAEINTKLPSTNRNAISAADVRQVLHDMNAATFAGNRFNVSITDPPFNASTASPDNAAAINAALAYCANAGCAVAIPGGTFLTCAVTVPTNSYLFGDNQITSILKLKNGCNTNMLVANGPSHNVTIERLKLDGNQPNNTTGRLIVHNGQRPTFRDLDIISAPEFAISTSNSAGYPLGGSEGHFERINIDTVQQTCWYHNGPTDSVFINVNMVDCGLAANNTYYGLFVDSGGSGRYFHFHYSGRTFAQNQPVAGAYIHQIGNDFDDSYFEGGITNLIVDVSNNTFTNSHLDAPTGPVAAKFNAGNLVFTGGCGGAAYVANPNYIGFQVNSAGNIINVSDQGCNNGIADFTSSGGSNILNASGSRSTVTCFAGTPLATDQVNLQYPNLSGCSVDRKGNIYSQNAASYVMKATGVNFNSTNTDTAISVVLPVGVTNYLVATVRIANASASISTATWGLFSATGGGGTAIEGAGQTISVTTAAANTNNNSMSATPTNAATQSFNFATLYFRVGTAQGSAATGDVMVTIVPIY